MGSSIERLPSENEITARWGRGCVSPAISILCITYNHREYIRDALAGILRQVTEVPYEVIVHDDASTDGTSDIIEEYRVQYPGLIRVIRQTENQRVRGFRALQFALPEARGRYIALCEGDDYWSDPFKLRKQYDVMEENRGIGLCVHPAERLDVVNGGVSVWYRHANSVSVIRGRRAIEYRGQFAPTASYFFRGACVSELPRWFFTAGDLPFADLFIEGVMGRRGILYIPDVCSVYRRNAEGSDTLRNRHSTDKAAISRMRATVKYVGMMRDIPGIDQSAITSRLENVYINYHNLAIARNSFDMGREVEKEKESVTGSGFERTSWWRGVASKKRTFFVVLHLAVQGKRLLAR